MSHDVITAADPPRTVADLLKRITQLNLLESAQVEEAQRLLASSVPEPRALAAALIQRGWLTPYQINQIFLGHGDTLVLGPYVLLERLGAGGMGQVFKARHRKLGRVVALKVIRKDRLENPDAVRRFRHEMQAAAQLSHPNIVHAFDADQVDDVHFIAMEYVEGIDLARRVKKLGPLPLGEACEAVRQTALGLQHAHERGLVHRDIKPSNLLLAGNAIKVLDLGLARLQAPSDLTDASSTLTEQGAAMGTPDYIAPEQTLDAHLVDIRADLYSLGCTLYFLLTGQVPFPGKTMGEKIARHQLHEPESIERLRPDVPGDVAFVLRKLMAKRPADRYQTPADLVADLTAIQKGLPLAKPQALTFDEPEDTFANLIDHSAETRAVLPRRRWRGRLLARAAVLAAGLLGLLAVLLLRGWLWPRVPVAADPVAAELEAFRKRWAGGENEVQLFVDVVAFQGKHAGQVQPVLEAARLLRQLPSPLDQLDPSRIPAAERYDWQPRDRLVALLGTQRFRLWENAPSAIAWDQARGWVAVADRLGRVTFWDGEGHIAEVLDSGTGNSLCSLALSADGQLLGAGSPDSRLHLWKRNGPRFQKWTTLTGHRLAIHALAFAQNNLLASGDAEGGIRLWDLASQPPAELQQLAGHSAAVLSLAFTGDGQRLVSAGGKQLKLWHRPSSKWQPGPPLEEQKASLGPLALTPDGRRLFVAGSDGLIRRWDLERPLPSPQATFQADDKAVRSLALCQNGSRLVTAGENGKVTVWTALERELPQQDSSFQTFLGSAALAAAPSGETICSCGNGIFVEVWDKKADVWQPRYPVRHHYRPVTALAFLPDGSGLLTGSTFGDGTILLWRLPDSAPVEPNPFPHQIAVKALAVAPHQQALVSGGVILRTWDLAGDRIKPGIDLGKYSDCTGVALAPTEPLAALASSKPFFQLFNLKSASARSPEILAAGQTAVTAVAYSPDGRLMASGDHKTVALWRRSGGKWQAALLPGAAAAPLVFAPGGRYLITAAPDRVLRLWHLQEEPPKPGLALPKHTADIHRLALAPDGETLVSADAQGGLIWWDLKSGQVLGECRLPGESGALAFAADSRHLAVGLGTGATGILRLHPSPGKTAD